ncbi:MAG TPA: MraY family glycosyltransferase [Rhizomicrobium sp.]|jgi:UDP-GlcNAc:undecaprenyl-phosphate GlcNAc-1-phosphate transferase|nr:MraY family glycosyltransferase [Rhizomicrobium sp.]
MLLDYLPLVITVTICVFARPVGEWLGVIDHPDRERKTHSGPTPMVGGIAVMVPLAFWAGAQIIWGQGADAGFYLSILLCGGGVAVLGFMDDQQGISAGGRLLLLVIFSVIALRLDPILSGDRVHFAAGVSLAVPPLLLPALTVLALAGFSSAVNMADGLNGLVLAFICIWSICLAFLGGANVSSAAAVIGAASLITLLYNLRGRLFLGDCGAFAVAFVVGVLAVRCHNTGRLPLETALVWFFVPVADCLRLIGLRLWRGRSPFQPDREHFQYRLAARLGEPWAIATYAGVVGFSSGLASLLPQFAFFGLTLASTVFFGFLLADGLASRGEPVRGSAQVGPNVVALEKKLAKRSGTGADMGQPVRG